MSANLISPTDRIERRLLILAGIFVGLFSLILTLSAAARLRSWQVDYRWSHWLGFAIWLGFTWLAHRQLSRLLPERDPYLLPVTALLTGWGLLTIWRLSDNFGLRQTAWLLIIGIAFLLAIRFDNSLPGGRILSYLRRFKYVWLTSGLVLTAATLILGTHPMGVGPRLWLGCCGFYFQPSEPLKLLLIVYLAAYLADRQAAASPARLLPLLTPTLLMTGLALLLLLFQRDLGTAAIFLLLYAVIVYTGTGKKSVLFASLVVIIIAAFAGYELFDVVNQRVEAWLNPWLDPSGRSYQIVQSLLSVANGGLVGRGVGMGSPSLVPIAQSDFIFSAISEETGLFGALGILGVLAIMVNRGMRIAMNSSDTFHRLLSTGLVVHLVGQSILIIAGNLRLFPLTGVTLPFISYGGSSLVVSFFELLCLVLISARQERLQVAQLPTLKVRNKINLLLSGGMTLGLAAIALVAGWWALVRAPNLIARTDNPRRTVADLYVKRGSILDSHGSALAESTGSPGSIQRSYPYPALGPLVGYTDPIYGQAGLEAGLDDYLRGLIGYPTLTMWWERLLNGQPPTGLNVRLSLDLELQAAADRLLEGHTGALVLLNAHTGEILAMASSPTFNANQLEASWKNLVNDPGSPLFNRAAMGMYPAGSTLGPFLLVAGRTDPTGSLTSTDSRDCALVPTGLSWGEVIAAGCPVPFTQLASAVNSQELISLLDGLGLFTPSPIFVETLSSTRPDGISDPLAYITGQQADAAAGITFKISPLQMALAASVLSNAGQRPAPRLLTAYETPQATWVVLPLATPAKPVFQELEVNNIAHAIASSSLPIWQVVAEANDTSGESTGSNPVYTWYLGGTLPEWKGAPLALAILLEEHNPQLLQGIGRSMFQSAIYP